ncbi:hypothetical protein KFE25_014007 [Diacronema lutheri]|uniref:Uncharacterized protein n=1 Tax=Diacronema lutheri TaxID=2081491 RepID=A0A8J5X8W0_DIALT|nr:hypothetical protein KFE25_014007 [Diacronema lutheri]
MQHRVTAAPGRRVKIAEPCVNVAHVGKRAMRNAGGSPRARIRNGRARGPVELALPARSEGDVGARGALRSDERLDSDDELGSPLPAIPAFSAKVLRNNESVSDFLAWCARAHGDEPDVRRKQADAFADWCASDSTKRTDRQSWIAAFTHAPSFLKRRQLEALALALSKHQLRQIALAHAKARRLPEPAISVLNLPLHAEHKPGLRARRHYTRARSAGRPSSPRRRHHDADSPSASSSESRTQRRLDLSQSGTGHAAAFAQMGAPPLFDECADVSDARSPSPSPSPSPAPWVRPSADAGPDVASDVDDDDVGGSPAARGADPLRAPRKQAHKPKPPPEPSEPGVHGWLACDERLDEYSTCPPEADDEPQPAQPLRRSARVPAAKLRGALKGAERAAAAGSALLRS